MRALISGHGWVDSWFRIQECLSCMAQFKAWNKEVYLGRQPQIYSPLWLGWSVWNQHYSCGNILLSNTSRRSWNGLWQTMKAGKTGLPYYSLNHMINFQGALKVFYALFTNLQSFIPSGVLSPFLHRHLSLFFSNASLEKMLMKYIKKLPKAPKLCTEPNTVQYLKLNSMKEKFPPAFNKKIVFIDPKPLNRFNDSNAIF